MPDSNECGRRPVEMFLSQSAARDHQSQQFQRNGKRRGPQQPQRDGMHEARRRRAVVQPPAEEGQTRRNDRRQQRRQCDRPQCREQRAARVGGGDRPDQLQPTAQRSPESHPEQQRGQRDHVRQRFPPQVDQQRVTDLPPVGDVEQPTQAGQRRPTLRPTEDRPRPNPQDALVDVGRVLLCRDEQLPFVVVEQHKLLELSPMVGVETLQQITSLFEQRLDFTGKLPDRPGVRRRRLASGNHCGFPADQFVRGLRRRGLQILQRRDLGLDLKHPHAGLPDRLTAERQPRMQAASVTQLPPLLPQ